MFGAIYNNPGHWQQLRIDGIPRLLARQLRVLRSQLGTDVDGREAYVQRVLLNVYGGPGVTNVWIDDLEIAGYVSAAPLSPGAASLRAGAAAAGGRGHPARLAARSAARKPRVPLRGRACA